jgi:hypothetical protein
MQIYIGNECKLSKQDYIRNNKQLGLLLTGVSCSPKQTSFPFILDNGAFSSYVNNLDFDEEAFMKSIIKVKDNPNLLWAIIPDKVAQGKESLKYSMIWREFLPNNINWYLAVQDGMLPEHIPIEFLKKIKGIFIGGTRNWKFKTGKQWVNYAHSNNLKCHIGRIGTLRLLIWAESINADSVDSSNFAQNKCHWDDLIEFQKSKPKQMSYDDWLEKTTEVKSGCDANDDGIPPNTKVSGILPTIL